MVEGKVQSCWVLVVQGQLSVESWWKVGSNWALGHGEKQGQKLLGPGVVGGRAELGVRSW